MTSSTGGRGSAMVPIFLAELGTQLQFLEQGIRELPSEPEKSAALLLKSAQSLRSAARLVGLKPAASLFQELENLASRLNNAFRGSADRPGKRPSPRFSDVEKTLQQAVDVLRQLLKVPAEQVPDELDGCAGLIQALCGELKQAIEAESKQPPSKAPGPAADTLDAALVDLFRTELANHTRTLEAGLVRLESEQTPQSVESLMRAAHSIKGAARIVGLDRAVGLAHCMEDVLSATAKGKVFLRPEAVDILLRGNDVFQRLTAVQPTSILAFLQSQADEIERTMAGLRSVLEGKQEIEAASVPKSAEALAPAEGRKTEQQLESRGEPALVRVMTETLNRLMGLAGESLVQAKTTRRFAQSLMRFKKHQLSQASLLQGLLDSGDGEGLSEAVRLQLAECVRIAEESAEAVRHETEEFALFSTHLEHLADRLYGEVVSTRMRPFSEGTPGFPRMVRDLARGLGKQVRFEILGLTTKVDRDILEKLEAPLTHLLRNAVDHGIEPPEVRVLQGKPAEGVLSVEARHVSGMLQIVVRDDGKGIDKQKIRQIIVEKGYVTADMAASLSDPEILDFLFLPGFSTARTVSETSGRGVGLNVVLSMVKEVGGAVTLESELGQGAVFNLSLPLTLSVLRTLVVKIGGEHYAFPLSRIQRIVRTNREGVRIVEDRQFCVVGEENIGVVDAVQILQLQAASVAAESLSILVISDRLNRYGLLVDELLGQQDLVVLPLDPRLGKVPNVSAGAILEDGGPVLILDAEDLVRSIDNLLKYGKPNRIRGSAKESPTRKKRILVVDDSLTVREVERRLLQTRGYEVAVAVDGMDGWNFLQTADFDLLISDVDMPRMDGIELVRRVKRSPNLKNLPVMIVSYKDREEDKMRGLEAGADYYLTKSSFHDESLAEAVQDLIGSA